MVSHLEDFLSYIQHEKRYSIHTIEAYRRDLELFSEYLSAEFECEMLVDSSHSMIRSWVMSSLEEELAITSVQRRISTLRSFFKYAYRRGWIDANPTTKIIAPKKEKLLPSFVKETEMRKLLEEITFEEEFQGERDKMILELLYQTGMRVSELVGLTHKDIDYKLSHVKVLGKRNKERLIPISEKLSNQLRVYDLKKTDTFEHETPNLIVNNHGEKASRKFVYTKVKYYLSQVSSLKTKSPHVLRHTFATHMLINGADINAIKEILGHASLAATQVYAHNDLEHLKQIHSMAHPRNKQSINPKKK